MITRYKLMCRAVLFIAKKLLKIINYLIRWIVNISF